MNNSTNYTETESGRMSMSELVAWCFAYGTVAALIVIGNTAAIVIFTTSKLMRKRTNYFLLSLAVADMLVGCISLPMYICYFVAYHKDQGDNYSGGVIRHIFVTLDVFTGFASIFALAFIALERLYLVILPNWHHTTPAYVYKVVIAVVWVLASLLAAIRLMFSFDVLEEEVLFDTTTTCSFLSLAVIIIAYIGIGVKMKRRVHEKTKRHIEKDRKLAITLSIVTVIYIVTWLPFYCMNVAFRFCTKGRDCTDVPNEVVFASKLLQYTNSFVNPVIYTFKIPEFRVALLEIIRRRTRRRSTLLSLRELRTSSRSTKHHRNGNGNVNDVFRKRGESNSASL